MLELLVRPQEVSLSEWKKMTEEEKRDCMLKRYSTSSLNTSLKSAWSRERTEEKR